MTKHSIAGLAVTMIVLVLGGACTPASDDNGPTEVPDPTGTPEPAPQPGEPEPVVETVAEGLDQAWGLAFLPGGDQLLVTTLPGVLSLVDVDTGQVSEVAGVPAVSTGGQGGLLDVALHPDFPETGWVYLTYSASAGANTTTHLARGRLDPDQSRLEGVEVLFTAEPARSGGAHYGSRVVFDHDGFLYLTIGDRGDKNFGDHPSQDPSNTLGTTVRLTADGSVPADNPFVDDPGVADEIYSYGHRNPQGMTVHPQTGEIWLSEHGENDGDEINVVQAGGNFGWPLATTACHYGTDTPLGDHPDDRADLVAPVHYWECGTGGFPPAGMTFYDGDEFPTWQGDLLVGGLASQYLARFTVDGHDVEEAEPLLAGEGWRIRDVTVGPGDGAIYVAIDSPNAPLVRIVNSASG